MENLILETAEKLVRHLENRAFEDIAAYYEFPAAVYFGDHVIVLHTQEELVHALSAYRDVLAQRDLLQIDTHVVDQPHEMKSRFTVTIANRYYDTDGNVFDTSQIQFFVQRDTDCWRIRLVEYVDYPCKQLIAKNTEIQRLCDRRPKATSLSSSRCRYLH